MITLRLTWLIFSLFAYTKAFGDTQSNLTLADALNSLRKNSSQDNIHRALDEHGKSRLQAELAHLREPPRIELRPSLAQDQERNSYAIESTLKKKWSVGADEGNLRTKYEKEIEGDKLSRSEAYRLLELDIAKLFAKTSLWAELNDQASASLVRALELSSQGEKAAKLGNLSGLAAMKANILLEEKTAEQKTYASSLALSLTALGKSIGVDLGPSAKLASPSLTPSAYTLDEKSLLVTKELAAKADALTAEANHVRNVREFETGIGLNFDQEAKRKEIFLQIEIPLGAANLRSYEAAAIATQRDVLQSDKEFAVRKAKLEFQSLDLEIKNKQEQLSIIERKQTAIEDLRDKSLHALNQGNGEFMELLEAEKELSATKIELLKARGELFEKILEMKSLVNGSLL